ncbi:hypothetical protein AEGHOMDF_2422 [Methylobacterium soli]|nr:hypothetical protein AEGHOMDF_2422 [Methylobacterium soli]
MPKRAWITGKAGSRLSIEIAVTAIIRATMATNSAKPGLVQAGTSRVDAPRVEPGRIGAVTECLR